MQNEAPQFAQRGADIKFSTFSHRIHGCEGAKYDPLVGYSKKIGFEEPLNRTIHLLKRIEAIWFVSEYRSRSNSMEVFLHHPIRGNCLKILTLFLDRFEIEKEIPIVFTKITGEEVQLDYRLLIGKLREMYQLYSTQAPTATEKPKVKLGSSDIFDEEKVFSMAKGRFATEADLRNYCYTLKLRQLFPIGQIEAFQHKYADKYFSAPLPINFPPKNG